MRVIHGRMCGSTWGMRQKYARICEVARCPRARVRCASRLVSLLHRCCDGELVARVSFVRGLMVPCAAGFRWLYCISAGIKRPSLSRAPRSQ